MSDQDDADSELSSLGSVSKGAGLFLGGDGFSRAVGLVTNLVLTRTLGTSLYGIFSYTTTLFSLFMVFTRLGGNKSMLRFLPEHEDDTRTQSVMLGLAYGTSLVASVLVTAAVYYLAPFISALTLDDPLFVDVLRVASFVLPFNTLANITTSVFKSMEKMEYDVAVSSVARPVFRLVFVGGAVLLGYSVVGAAAGFVVMGVLTLGTGLVILVRRSPFSASAVRRPSTPEVREYYNYSLPLTFNQLGGFLYNRTDILMVGFFLSSSAVGIYNVSVTVATILSLPLIAFNQLFPPIASRLYHNDELDELEDLYGTVTRWIFTLSLCPAIAALLYSGDVLAVFGEGFTRGGMVLSLFVFSQVTNCFVGPSGYLLMMSDHQYLTLVNQLASGMLNVVLNYVLITQFGLIGAAIATSAVLAGINVLRIVEVWYLEGLLPYDRTFLKPVASGVVAAAVMYGLSLLLDQYVLLVVGGAAGAASYFGVLYLLGFEQEELDLLSGIIPSERLSRLLADRG